MTTCASEHTFKMKTPWVEILYYWSVVCILFEHNSEIHLVESCKGFDIDNMDKSMIHSFVHQGILREKLGLFIVIMFCIFLVVILHTMFSRKSHCLPPGPWPWSIMGNLLMLGKHPHLTLTRWAEKYGPYAPSTQLHQHYGGIFAYNGQGIFENPRSCVPISSIFTCIQDSNQKLEHGSDI